MTEAPDPKTPAAILLSDSMTHLRGLLLLPTEQDAKEAANNSPRFDSVDVIAANELAITKRVGDLIKGGTAAGLVASLGGLGVGAWKDWGDPVKAALLLAGALVLAAGLLGLARVMDGDVRGRAAATVAQLEARSRVGEALVIHASSSEPKVPGGSEESTTVTETRSKASQPTEQQVLAALAAYRDVNVTSGNKTLRVIGAEWNASEGMEVKLANGDNIQLDRVTAFSASNPWKRRAI